VVEVDSETRKKLEQIRVKLGWTICRVDDYISVKRWYRCSRFNQNHRNAKRRLPTMYRKPQPKTVHSCTNRTQMHKLHGIQKNATLRHKQTQPTLLSIKNAPV